MAELRKTQINLVESKAYWMRHRQPPYNPRLTTEHSLDLGGWFYRGRRTLDAGEKTNYNNSTHMSSKFFENPLTKNSTWTCSKITCDHMWSHVTTCMITRDHMWFWNMFMWNFCKDQHGAIPRRPPTQVLTPSHRAYWLLSSMARGQRANSTKQFCFNYFYKLSTSAIK